MPGKSGLDLLIEIKQKYPDLKVIILSMHNEEEIIIRAFKTGASAYLNKDSIPEDLIKTIKSVYRGENYIGASLTAMTALQNLKQERIQPHNLLSQREYQIFCLIASGNSNKEIADILSINAKTVSTLRTRLLDKMGLKTNSGIAAYALNNGITLNR
jgi:DNA-binding NarL/FixJ family response regulator